MKTDHDGIKEKLEVKNILVDSGFANANIRLVTHRGVKREDCEKAVKAIKKLT
jgi:threonine aldolase